MSNTCLNLILNCGTSNCSITCDATSQNCGGIQVNTENAFAFQCIEVHEPSGGDEHPCIDAPPRKLPPTPEPTFYPTVEPTTAYPSVDPTYNPTQQPTTYPTTPWPVVVNVTLTITIKEDANITVDDITNLIKNTSSTHLDRLFVVDDYQLTVDVINVETDILKVTVIVTTNGDVISVDDDGLVAENEKEINRQYGDKVDIINSTANGNDDSMKSNGIFI